MFNDRFAYLFPPLAVMYLSSYLKKETHHQVDVLDCVVDNLDFDQIKSHVARTSPDLVGISATATHNLVNVAKSIQAIRAAKPDVFIVMGGPHVNSFPEFSVSLKGLDAAILGDGEEPLAQLLTALENNSDIKSVPNIILKNDDGSVYTSETIPNVEDLDSFPFPDRGACPPGKYYTPGMRGARATTLISSRGCPYRCVFCNVPTGYRSRSPENIAKEMKLCVEKYRVQDIHFIDDLFNLNPERVMAISEEILRQGVKVGWGYKAGVRQTNREMIRLAKKAGCYRVHYGVETFTSEGLKALNKKVTLDEIKEIFAMTKDEGVKTIAYMIIGCPFEKSAKEILGVDKFMKELNPDYVVYSLFTPYPDAPIFKDGVNKGLWAEDCWEKFMKNPTKEHDLPTAWEEHLSKAELLDIFKIVNRKFYFSAKVLIKTLFSIRSFSEVRRIFLGGISLIRMEFLRPGGKQI